MTAAARVLSVFLTMVLPFVACCGTPDSRPAAPVPPWAHVAPEQVAEAKKHGVPVAFENDLGMRFVLIPAGTFWMGAPRVPELDKYDTAPHEVTLSRPFYMQITEVTNAQYRSFRPDHDSGDDSGHGLSGDLQPVVMVSWHDAAAFASWLEQIESRPYRLPTEAQWERACRAGSRTRYAWGDNAAEASEHANGLDLLTQEQDEMPFQALPCNDPHRVTARVGSYQPSGWGLYDMHGNVSEWCLDWYAEDYPRGRVIDPVGPTAGRARVRRGGHWYSGPWSIGSGYRDLDEPDVRDVCIGFRLVSPLPEPGE